MGRGSELVSEVGDFKNSLERVDMDTLGDAVEWSWITFSLSIGLGVSDDSVLRIEVAPGDGGTKESEELKDAHVAGGVD